MKQLSADGMPHGARMAPTFTSVFFIIITVSASLSTPPLAAQNASPVFVSHPRQLNMDEILSLRALFALMVSKMCELKEEHRETGGGNRRACPAKLSYLLSLGVTLG